jgi:hypothetical protein
MGVTLPAQLDERPVALLVALIRNPHGQVVQALSVYILDVLEPKCGINRLHRSPLLAEPL